MATPTDTSTASQNMGDNVRKNLVQVFFGLVLTQMAVYITSLVDIWDGGTTRYWGAWSHIILAFSLTTTSWFGWQMSVRKSQLQEEASVFQSGFILSILDIILVTLYFLLVHEIEMEGVAAFPPRAVPTLTDPSALAETIIILSVFALYALWDTVNFIVKGKEYGPWPSIMCLFLTASAFVPTFYVAPDRGGAVIWIDSFLFGIVFLFRALKRLQKWNFENLQDKRTFRFRQAPAGVKTWIVVCAAWSVITFLIGVMPLARSWVCD